MRNNCFLGAGRDWEGGRVDDETGRVAVEASGEVDGVAGLAGEAARAILFFDQKKTY